MATRHRLEATTVGPFPLSAYPGQPSDQPQTRPQNAPGTPRTGSPQLAKEQAVGLMTPFLPCAPAAQPLSEE